MAPSNSKEVVIETVGVMFGVVVVCAMAYLGLKYVESPNGKTILVNKTPAAGYATPAPQVEIQPLPTTFIVTPGIRTVEVTPPAPERPCYYSDGINRVATQIPSGQESAIQKWRCHDGRWVLGWGDWINNKGKWRKDGINELGEIEYDENGRIAGWKFYEANGTVISIPGQ